MLTVGENFPAFNLTAVVDLDPKKAFEEITEQSFPGKWKVVFFWPKDFTFVCPTEIAAFGKLDKEFKARDAQVLGASIDSEFVHLAWRSNKDESEGSPFPDALGHQARPVEQLGILDPRPASPSARPTSSTRRVSSASSTSPT
jgi:alkyl hydroperoxide reductase subunit AhpC